MKFSSLPSGIRYAVMISLLAVIAVFGYGFFQKDRVVEVTDCPGLPVVPEKQEIPVTQVSFKTNVHPTARIQAAILLDVSNSMDGLIEQAKAQLWNMVNTMGLVRCDGMVPAFELALYEYGRPVNGEHTGYIRQLHAFTTNLDSVSNTLFSLYTNGGDEYCPQVIVNSADQLSWDGSASTYKVIFIAGNETFRQGPLNWAAACEKARDKGIIVNTIYCGSREAGIQDYWNLGAECGNGNYTNINHDAVIEDIPTPYDSTLFVLNDKLNGTYIAYGAQGRAAALMQADVDQKNYTMSRSAAAKRVEVKGKKELYKNEGWDLVDAVENNKVTVSAIDKEALPDSLKKKTGKELEQFVAVKAKERGALQDQIADLAKKRNQFLAEERVRRASGSNDATLESEIEKIIRAQVKRYNMTVE